jgi:hypothetical protein
MDSAAWAEKSEVSNQALKPVRRTGFFVAYAIAAQLFASDFRWSLSGRRCSLMASRRRVRVIDADARSLGDARIAVGESVATAHGIVERDARLRTRLANTGRSSLTAVGFLGKIAELDPWCRQKDRWTGTGRPSGVTGR